MHQCMHVCMYACMHASMHVKTNHKIHCFVFLFVVNCFGLVNFVSVSAVRVRLGSTHGGEETEL